MRSFFIIILILFATSITQASVTGSEVTYQADDTTLKGYLATDPANTSPRPGILVVHEWWGHNNYARKRADMLAELGYTALAVDMYGEGKQALHPADAGKFSGEVKKNMPLATARFTAAMEFLKKQPTVDPARIAAIGYCFGGGIVLEMARSGLDLDAVVSFHGSLTTDNPAQKGEVKARVLVLNGEADTFVKPEQIEAFKAEMKAAGVSFKFVNYPDAIHSFTNPEADEYGKKFSIPVGYNAEADKKSWQEMKNLFAEIF